MPRRSVLAVLAATLWVAALGRVRQGLEACLPGSWWQALEEHVTAVAHATGCVEPSGGGSSAVRAALLATVVLLPVLAAGLGAPGGAVLVARARPLVETLRGLVARLVPPAVVGEPARARTRGPRAVAVGAARGTRIGHASRWSHRGPPRFA